MKTPRLVRGVFFRLQKMALTPLTPVGASLLANAIFQSPYHRLTHRIREQARSHSGLAQRLEMKLLS